MKGNTFGPFLWISLTLWTALQAQKLSSEYFKVVADIEIPPEYDCVIAKHNSEYSIEQ